MIPATIEELNRVYEECKKITTGAAIISALGGAVPVPAGDVAVDIYVLIKYLDKISKRFGLSPEQINTYDEKLKILVYEIIKKMGAKLAGKYITKELVVAILKKLGIRVTVKQVAKYISIIGQVISSGISFTAMKLVLNGHINECYEVCKDIINSRNKNKEGNT